jgi:HlyD family secretion protein
MVPETEKIDFKPIEIPQVRRGFLGYVKIGAALMALGGVAWAWQIGSRSPMFSQSSKQPLNFVEIDRGDIDIVVVEQGTVESANNTTVRCQVEALIGTVGGTQGGTSKGSGASGSGTGQGSGGAVGADGSLSGGGGTGQGSDSSATSKSKTKKKAGASSSSKSASKSTTGSTASSSGGSSATTSGSSASSSSTSSSMSSSSSSMSSSSGSGAGGGSGSSAGASGTTTTTATKPVIRSFSYVVVAHMPLRPATAKAADTTAQKNAKQQQGQGGGGGGGGGRGGGRGKGGRGGGGGGMGGMDEKPGSTRILEIVKEGKRVKSGDIVAKLDGAPYEDEEQVQKIRYLQAQSYVEHANTILAVSLITLTEYRDGIYPQDLQLVRQYIQTCQLEFDRLARSYQWSQDMQKKGYRTFFQVEGDRLAFEQSKIALSEANGMLDRLVNQTGPKIIKSLEANVRAIQADKLTQDASFNLEDQRLKRIKKNIENCIVRAPGDGIVVYVNQADRWGTVTAPIDEGVTLRQDQPIFSLPDPKHMRVKARVNESKVTLIHTGQRVIIAVDAFPEQQLHGTVGEVTAINTPLNASDVRVYYANVEIDQGFDDLRPGLSAEVTFNVDSRPNVTRVPLSSVRWVGNKIYVALYNRVPDPSRQNTWSWRAIELGLSDTQFAEVTSGLQVGDRIVAVPRDLPAPTPESVGPAATNVARVSPEETRE